VSSHLRNIHGIQAVLIKCYCLKLTKGPRVREDLVHSFNYWIHIVVPELLQYDEYYLS